MIVCLDARGMRWPEGTGVTTYARVLEATLPQAGCTPELLASDDRGAPGRAARWAEAAFGASVRDAPAPGLSVSDGGLPDGGLADGGLPDGGLAVREVPDLFRTAQVRFDMRRGFLTVRDRASPPDVMHWTCPLPLRFAGVPNVYTVHDLIPLLHPELTPISRSRTARLLRRLGREAAHVATVSEASRREILATLGWPADRVTNTLQAVLPERPSAEAAAEAARSLGLAPGGYLLHAGSVEPRKNIARLVAAHAASGVRAPLVLAGPDGWRARAELAGARGSPLVVRAPWLERGRLLALMRGARAVVAPSLAEGFGLPVAEAMALGTPVLTSAEGALAEVAGGAAMLVDPRDGQAMAEALRALDADPTLRADLAARGRARAEAFTPAAYAARLRALYASVSARAEAEAGRGG